MNKQQRQLNHMMGGYGAEIVAATTAKTGQKYSGIQFCAEGTLTAFSANGMEGTWTGVTFPAGFAIFGDITGFTADVAVVAYRSGEK